ncbi:hypothetical protein CEXT_571561 [Caerostris extrusa]|uniref:Uncharacterized protein n=1 Tax=Caerostris extrusa TaxID=172846 RepID=A0AAV4WGV8_CAEEX|nr:hypothetical protein CEXT_571561 [Caerostris extrusa]
MNITGRSQWGDRLRRHRLREDSLQVGMGDWSREDRGEYCEHVEEDSFGTSGLAVQHGLNKVKMHQIQVTSQYIFRPFSLHSRCSYMELEGMPGCRLVGIPATTLPAAATISNVATSTKRTGPCDSSSIWL